MKIELLKQNSQMPKILENLNGESSSDPADIIDGTMAQEAMKEEIDAVENSDKSISISSHSSLR